VDGLEKVCVDSLAFIWSCRSYLSLGKSTASSRYGYCQLSLDSGHWHASVLGIENVEKKLREFTGVKSRKFSAINLQNKARPPNRIGWDSHQRVVNNSTSKLDCAYIIRQL
jgi:hypothetical protein